MTEKIIGPHVWDLSVADLKKLVFITAVDAALYIIVLALAKVSILLFYLKLARERWFTIAIWSTMAFIIAFSTGLFLSLVFACTPLKMVWDVTITDGHCINRGKNYLATAGLNASTDIIMLVRGPFQCMRSKLIDLFSVVAHAYALEIASEAHSEDRPRLHICYR